jgi:predicted 3-demethylubiquinone-9 3-methyltransferase (glyoxalase superfamily)
MAIVQKIVPMLWFDSQAEEAAKFYVSVFENSSIELMTRYRNEGFEAHGKPNGSVLTVAFRLEGQAFIALNGGPHFTFNESISFVVLCETQAEIDRYWDRLSEGGDEKAQQCGWLKDRYGVSWQIVPDTLDGMLSATETARSERVMKALLRMKKLELAALLRAFDGS